MIVCPNCKKKVNMTMYRNGCSCGINVSSYPYESGETCPKCKSSWSNLEITRGAFEEVKTDTKFRDRMWTCKDCNSYNTSKENCCYFCKNIR